MKYQIVYTDCADVTERAARAIAAVLPAEETKAVNLSAGMQPEDGEVYLIGFALRRGVLPLEIMDLLETLEGKTILFFVICGIEPIAEYKQVVEYKLAPFMPEQYNYCGMILCPSQASEETLAAARKLLAEDPGNEYASKVLREYAGAEEKPTHADLERLCRFVLDRLGL